MKIKIICTTALIISAFFSMGQKVKFKSQLSEVFDSTIGALLLHQCSRMTPADISAFWAVQQHDVDSLESNFFRIYSVWVTKGPQTGKVYDFGFQCTGVVIKGRKYIYINAFNISELKTYKKDARNSDHKKEPITVCDGGNAFWGVLFDIQTKEFSQLSFNGVG